MKLALHRSITFWSGLLVIGFIVWAWLDSAWRWSYQGSPHFVLSNRDSGLVTFYRGSGALSNWSASTNTNLPKLFGSRSNRPRFARPGWARELQESELAEFRQHGTRHGRPLDPIVAGHLDRGYAPGWWVLFIPHWCLLLALLPPWLGLIYWRYRRIARRPALAEEAAPSPSSAAT